MGSFWAHSGASGGKSCGDDVQSHLRFVPQRRCRGMVEDALIEQSALFERSNGDVDVMGPRFTLGGEIEIGRLQDEFLLALRPREALRLELVPLHGGGAGQRHVAVVFVRFPRAGDELIAKRLTGRVDLRPCGSGQADLAEYHERESGRK